MPLFRARVFFLFLTTVALVAAAEPAASTPTAPPPPAQPSALITPEDAAKSELALRAALEATRYPVADAEATRLRAYRETHLHPGGEEALTHLLALSVYIRLLYQPQPTPEVAGWITRGQAVIVEAGAGRFPLAEAELALARGFYLLREGKIDESEQVILAAYTSITRLSEPSSYSGLLALRITSYFYLIQGRAREGEPFARRLAETLEKIDPAGPATAIAYNNLCAVALMLGQHERARPLLEKTVAMLEARLGPDNPRTSMARNNLAVLLKDQGLFDQALPLYARSAAGLRDSSTKDKGMILTNYGFILGETGRTVEALEQLQLAQPELEQAYGPQSLFLASNLSRQARVLLLQGKVTEALPLAQRAYAMALLPPGDTATQLAIADTLLNIQLALGHHAEAVSLGRELLAARTTLLTEQLSYSAESERLGSLRTIPPYDAITSIGNADLIALTVLRLKGLVLDAMIEDQTLARRSDDPEIKQLLARIRQLSRDQSRAQRAAQTTQITSLATELERAEQELARKVTRLGVSRQALSIETSTVTKNLRTGEALVEYIRYQQWQADGHGLDSYGALVLTANQPPRWLPLGPAAPIEKAVRLYEQYVHDGGNDTWPGELRALVFDPIAAALPAGTTTLYFSPDAALHQISFAALPRAGGKFIGEDFIVAYVASGRDLVNDPGSPAVPSSTQSVVGFANPAFSPARQLAALPNSAQETADLLQLAGTAHPAKLFTGAEATVGHLRQLPPPYVLHLATHGFSPPRTGEDPLATALASRLALAGDDVLTAADAATLDLQGTWLTTLAACDSGRGTIAQGEGLLGLRRSFLRAGTKHLALALWRLPDDATTRQLLGDFYRGVFSGQPPAEALAAAQGKQLRLLAEREGPGAAIRKAGSLVITLRR